MRQLTALFASLALALGAAGAQGVPNDSCTVSSVGTISFGTYYWSTVEDKVVSATPFSFTCTNLPSARTLTLSLDVDDREPSSALVRRLYNGTARDAMNTLLYVLTLPDAGNVRWGDGPLDGSLPGTLGSKVFSAALGAGSPTGAVNIRITIPAGQMKTVGSYGDSLTVTITLN